MYVELIIPHSDRLHRLTQGCLEDERRPTCPFRCQVTCITVVLYTYTYVLVGTEPAGSSKNIVSIQKLLLNVG